MNKRAYLISMSIVTAAGFAVSPVNAQQATSSAMTDSHVQRIQKNCSEALRTIQQIHTSDLPLRVDRGQTYDSISSKLMAPLNSRLILAKLDASALVKITSQYDKALTKFRSDYKAYDDKMSDVLQIDCERQPVSFYDTVSSARQLRENVHADVTTLRELVVNYEKAFDTFRAQFKASGQTTKDTN